MTLPPLEAEKMRLQMLPLPLERDVFLRTLIRHLAGALHDVIGLPEAKGFIAIVGQKMGDEMSESYKTALGLPLLDRVLVRDVCIDLKRRIGGEFFVISEDEEKIVFGNTKCPFEDKVVGREALCMMTSNVFGTIAAENLGYGKVVLNQTIAGGAETCRVTLYLEPTPSANNADGREYFQGS